MNLSDERAVDGEDMYPVEVFPGPPGDGPDIAVHIAANAIGSIRRHVHKDAPVGQPHAIHDVIYSARARSVRGLWNCAIHDVEQFLVGREAQAIGLSRSQATTVSTRVVAT